jgi:membrane-associated phospholipid phosphatase
MLGSAPHPHLRADILTTRNAEPTHGGQAHGSRLQLVLALCASLVLGAQGTVAHAGDSVESSGDLLAVVVPGAAFALTLKHRDREGRHQFYKAFGANLLATLVLKETVHKERPDGSGNDSFPSGHSSVAFQGAAFVQRRYGLKPAWPLYAAASYVGWTRVDANKHDTSDVLAGAALGIASSFLLAKRAPRVAFVPIMERDLVGIRVAGSF